MREDKVVGVPPDELRCEHNVSSTRRCKGWRLEGSFLCQNHYFMLPMQRRNSIRYINNQRRVQTQTKEIARMEERRKRSSDYTWAGFSSEGEEDIRKKKTRRNFRVFKTKETDGCDIPELIEIIETVYQDKEFQLIDHIFKLKEEKMNVEKEEAEELMAYLGEELGIYDTKYAELSLELEEKEKETIALERKVRELESEKIRFEVKQGEYDGMCQKLQEDIEIACQGERVSNERIQHLKRSKTVAENETEVWKNRCKELEIQVLREQQLSRRVYEAPRGLPAEISDAGQWKKRGCGKTDPQGQTNSALQVQVKEEGVDYVGSIYEYCNVYAKESQITRLAGQGNIYASIQARNQTEICSAVNGAGLSDMKIEEESSESGLAELAGIDEPNRTFQYILSS